MPIIGFLITLGVYLVFSLLFGSKESTSKTPPHFVRKNIKWWNKK